MFVFSQQSFASATNGHTVNLGISFSTVLGALCTANIGNASSVSGITFTTSSLTYYCGAPVSWLIWGLK